VHGLRPWCFRKHTKFCHTAVYHLGLVRNPQLYPFPNVTVRNHLSIKNNKNWKNSLQGPIPPNPSQKSNSLKNAKLYVKWSMRKPNFFGGKFAILTFGPELPIPAFSYPSAASGGCRTTNFAPDGRPQRKLGINSSHCICCSELSRRGCVTYRYCRCDSLLPPRDHRRRARAYDGAGVREIPNHLMRKHASKFFFLVGTLVQRPVKLSSRRLMLLRPGLRGILPTLFQTRSVPPVYSLLCTLRGLSGQRV
jgi:hypothetical protein